jgi:hypothetical protein
VTHIRTSIREGAVTLVTGLTTTSTRVYKSRNLPLTTAEFPCLCVFARGEAYDYAQAGFSGGKAYPVRNVDLHIQGYVKDSDSSAIETTLDTIAKEVETALFAGFPFGGAFGMTLGSQEIEVNSDGDESFGSIDMVFNVAYRTVEGLPETAI